MKYLIGLLFIFPYSARAQAGVQNVHEVANSTNTIIQTIGVSSQPAIDVATATSSGTLSGYYSIEVYNLAASTSTLNCGFDPMVSTTSTNVWYGREVPAGVGVYFAVPSYRKLWCMSQSINGTTKATITQLK